MQACSATPEGSDGRTVFAAQANGQLKMPKMGNYCLTMLGDAATKADIASAADVSVAQQHLVLFIRFDSMLGACGERGCEMECQDFCVRACLCGFACTALWWWEGEQIMGERVRRGSSSSCAVK